MNVTRRWIDVFDINQTNQTGRKRNHLMCELSPQVWFSFLQPEMIRCSMSSASMRRVLESRLSSCKPQRISISEKSEHTPYIHNTSPKQDIYNPSTARVMKIYFATQTKPSCSESETFTFITALRAPTAFFMASVTVNKLFMRSNKGKWGKCEGDVRVRIWAQVIFELSSIIPKILEDYQRPEKQ